MKDDNRKAKLMTIGIAVVLILIICGISVIIHAIHRRDSQETGSKLQEDIMDYPLTVVVPAFMTSELKRGFTAGLLLYIPFLLLDIIVSSTLMSMGMIMLPPATIALPFKVLLFVSVDGWELLFSSIVKSFN